MTTADAFVPAGHWLIDPDHSSVNFVVGHLGITKLRGRFMDLRGRVESIDGAFSGEAVVATNSIDTGSATRDKHLQGPDFLNAEGNPQITFVLEQVRTGETGYLADGTLTLAGVTRPVVFEVTFGGIAEDPYGHERVGLEFDATILRSDFGITYDSNGTLVSGEIELEVDLSLVREPSYRAQARQADTGSGATAA